MQKNSSSRDSCGLWVLLCLVILHGKSKNTIITGTKIILRTIYIVAFLYLAAYLSSYYEKIIKALYNELA